MDNNNSILSNIFGEEGILGSSKIIRYLIVLGLLGVFLMLLGDFGTDVSKSNVKSTVNSNNEAEARSRLSLEEEFEKKLASILKQIDGVGKVAVDITLDSSSEYMYARDYQDSKQEVKEEDTSGGTRTTNQIDKNSNIVILNKSGEESPLIKKEIKPKVRGALVIAEGAENSYVKASLFRAVKVGLGIPSHKIIILPKER